MAIAEQVQEKSLPSVKAALAGFVLAILFCVIFAVCACSLGLLFSGLDLFFAILVSSFFSGLLTAACIMVLKLLFEQSGWRVGIYFTLAPILALCLIYFMSRIQTSQELETFMQPAAIPTGVHIQQGRRILFSSYVHFTGSPSDIAAAIRAKGLLDSPTKYSDQEDMTNVDEAIRTRKGWDWWQPAMMPNPKFYFLHHKSDAVQGWDEGWWVNDKTNEVFAYISS